MADREHFERPIQDEAGNLRLDSVVRVLEPGTLTLIPQTLYAEATGETALGNPFTTASGVIDFYLNFPRKVRIGVVTPGSTEEVFFDDISVGDDETYKETLAFTLAGAAPVGTMAMRFYVDDACQVLNVRVSAGIAPNGADLVIDVNKNGSSLFEAVANQPRVPDGGHMGVVDLSAAEPAVTLDPEDYLTIDIDQVGSNTAGADIVVQVRIRRLA